MRGSGFRLLVDDDCLERKRARNRRGVCKARVRVLRKGASCGARVSASTCGRSQFGARRIAVQASYVRPVLQRGYAAKAHNVFR